MPNNTHERNRPMSKHITININEDFVQDDPELTARYVKRAQELLADMDIVADADDFSSTYSWKDTGDDDITEEEGFWVQGLLERAWNEACGQ